MFFRVYMRRMNKKKQQYENVIKYLDWIYKKYNIWDLLEVHNECDYEYWYSIWECIWFNQFVKLEDSQYSWGEDKSRDSIHIKSERSIMWHDYYKNTFNIKDEKHMMKWSISDDRKIGNINKWRWFENFNSEWWCWWSDGSWYHYKIKWDQYLAV